MDRNEKQFSLRLLGHIAIGARSPWCRIGLGLLLGVHLLGGGVLFAQSSDDVPAQPPRAVWRVGMKPDADTHHRAVYDPATKRYTVYEMVGNVVVGQPRVLTEREYRDYRREEAIRNYWGDKRKEAATGNAPGGGLLPKLRVGGENFDRIFGSNVIEIIPQGSAELLFGITHNNTENFTIPEEMRSNTTFDFNAKLQVNLTGKVGEKLKMDVKYNTEATFDFEQNVKVEYTGDEDEIIQKIEAGNVTMPLPGTLITGSQSLFGFRTDLKFGRLNVSTIFSQRKGQAQTIEVKGGAQSKRFEVRADQYEANRHFFLSKYFYDIYDQALSHLPLVLSGVEITKIQVWVTNKQGRFDDSRDVLALVDLGEIDRNIFAPGVVHGVAGARVPDNASNDLYANLTTGIYSGIRDLANATQVLAPLAAQNYRQGQDFEKLENARLLKPSEYTLNKQLGFISLNMSLNNDEILCVAYEYTYGGRTYRVGEFSSDGIDAPQALVVKLLKGTDLSPAMPTWQLMMKNIYAIGAYQISSADFQLDVLYRDDEIGTAVNYLTAGKIRNEPLLSVLNLDNLNSNGDSGPDGVFDFVEGVTVLASTGRVIFPEREPFGRYLARKIDDPTVAKSFVFPELYDSTLSRAQQMAEKNKFILRGEYRSNNASEISLNAPNVPKGSVVVTAGGRKLVENTDYVVDYLLGTVKIINQGLLESGTPIKISLESNLGIDFQVKTLMGTHLDYQFSDRFNIGGTILNLSERPLTKKVNYGNEAVSNTIWGLNGSYETELPWLTKAVDWLPLIETKEKSTLTLEGEMAQFIPGQSSSLDKRGSVYLDDFEANKSSIDIRMWSSWSIASTPQGQATLFPEGALVNDLAYGMNRARLAWYYIDPLFLRNSNLTPAHIRNDPESQSSHFVREVEEQELFPNRNIPQGQPTTISVLNMAFYPQERGPYNYDATRVDAIGALQDPKSRWGGVMRSLPVTDFEQNNIEYIEFWLMDPFVEDRNAPGGDLYFNLGNVSEDILRDGRKAFENGLPGRDGAEPAVPTAWGLVPKVQSSVMAFDNDPEARRRQDVGLDGLSSQDETNFYTNYLQQLEGNLGSGSPAVEAARQDPSSDDYRYFRSTQYDNNRVGILDRYKYFNNTEGNSPTAEQSPESYPTSSTTLPDVEDLNRDNTLSDNESYYQYRVSLRPGDLQVGKNYVTDKVQAKVKLANGNESEVAWYQFKIPVREYENRIGYIQDFKSIRFVRMFLRDFDRPLFLRFATLALVRGEWRRYERSLLAGQEIVGGGSGLPTTFDIAAVNIEENSTRTPVNYVLPPKVTREIDASQSVQNELNEQSMELKVVNLQDGDARAAYRNVGYDLRQYRKLGMDVHAEAIEGEPLKDGELRLFLRLGSDYTNNYYEYEIPLSLTAPGYYSNGSEADRREVWPEENAVDIELQSLWKAKLARDAAARGNSSISSRTPFVVQHGNGTITVLGYPTLEDVRVLMVGIRNPRKRGSSDDGQPKSGIVWVNELRLSKIADNGGWAALASMNVRVADLGALSLTGRLETPGFGALESKINTRAKETTYQYDANANLEFGRFFPKKWEVSIPMFVSYGETFANPQYNPLDTDVPFDEALANLPKGAMRDSLRNIAQDYTRRRSINFTNVRVNQSSQNPMLWDPANFSVSYAYSEQNSHNVKTEYRNQVTHRGALAYAYNARPKNFEPFRSVGWLRSDYLALIRDFNFTPLPRQLSFRTEVNRSYVEQRLRNIHSPMLQIRPTFAKAFEWNRSYGLNWDLTRNLRFDFTATNLALIDEPAGVVDRDVDPDLYREWRHRVWRSVRHFGTTTQYSHKGTVSWNIPINKLPFLQWLSANASYNADYRWDAAPRLADTVRIRVGNKIQNASTLTLTGSASLTGLYQKIGYLNRVNQEFEKLANGQPLNDKQEYREVSYANPRFSMTAERAKTVTHNLKTEEVTVKLYDADGKEVPCDVEVRDGNRVRLRTTVEVKRGRVEITGRQPKSSISPMLVLDGIARVLMGIRNVSVSYSTNDGTFLPGYLPRTKVLGLSRLNGNPAPGWPFVAGIQQSDFPWRAADNGWLLGDSTQIDRYRRTHALTYSYRISVEPFPYARLDITGTRTYSRDYSAHFQKVNGGFQEQNPTVSGSFSITTILIGTAFQRSSSRNGYRSAAFQRFADARSQVANQLAEQRTAAGAADPRANPRADGYPDGIGPLSQDVLIPALLSAYTGQRASRYTGNYFPLIPLPNWQFTYDGLSRIAAVKDVLRQLSIRHGYRANYAVGGYSLNEHYQAGADGLTYVRDLQENFMPKYLLTNISLTEQFSPLVGIDLAWVNSLTTKAEVRKSRSMTLSLANNQMTDMDSWEYLVGAGYRFEDLPLLLKTNLNGERVIKSDLRLQADFGIRNTSTILRRLSEGTNTPTAGQWSYTLKLSVDYMITQQVTIRAFFDRMVNKPLVSLSFPTSTTSFGLSVRFSLEQ